MGCLAFHACTEGEWEIAVSYWPDAASIAAWRNHPDHRAAQVRGMRDWYTEHHVDVAEVVRSYGSPTGADAARG